MFEVEIRVAGGMDPSWTAGRLPGFTTEPAPPITTIRGVLGPDENLSAIMRVLGRHGLTPIEVWVDTFAACACPGSPRPHRVRRGEGQRAVDNDRSGTGQGQRESGQGPDS